MNQIREGKKSKGKELKTLDRAGKKLFNVLVDNRVLQWIYDGHKKHLKVSYALYEESDGYL